MTLYVCFGFLDFTEVFARIPVVDVAHGARSMLCSREMAQIAEHTVRIGRVRNDDGTVGRKLLSYDEVCTCPSVGHVCCQQKDSQQ